MIIGLTGENCAGKGTIAEYLRERGFSYLSLSDILRKELSEEGKEITRENLINKGNALRREHGPGALAKKTINRLEPGKDYVIDSIRNGAEAAEIKKLPSARLLYVSASPEIRFARMKKRKRENDPESFEEFLKTEAMEMKNKEADRQSLSDAFALADRRIANQGSVEELRSKIEMFLKEE
ncbi:AAA family ATPase [Candidatus Micrarchaeota archaeon]|nr:AAA family ATPase [Candidatus Micrarchaeota archaeon]